MVNRSQTRREFVTAVGTTATAALAGCTGGGSGDFPNQPLRYIVPYSEGGGTDVYARALVPAMSEHLDEDIEIENIEGAGGLVGVNEAIGDQGDGHTVVGLQPPAEVFASLLAEDEAIRELEGVGIYGATAWTVIANPDHEIEDIDDMLDRYRDGEFSDVGGQQPGSAQHVIAHFMRDEQDYDWQWGNYVAYTGTGPIAQAVVSNEIPVGIGTENGTQSVVESEDADIVAVLSSEGSTVNSETEPITEFGYPDLDFVAHQDRSLHAPPGTDEAEIEILAEALEAAVNDEEVQEWSEDSGNNVEWGGGSEEAMAAVEDGFEEVEENIDMSEIEGADD